MTDERIRIWNLLHDGEVTAVSDESSTSVTIFVSIPYLRRRFAPVGDSVVISPSGVTLLEFVHFDGEVSSLCRALEIGGPEILATESKEMPIALETTLGQLRLAFESMDLALDTGRSLTFQALQQASEAYWSEWKARSGEAS
jgi:hypothetical protein